MKFERLRIERLRCLDEVELHPGPGLNFFVGGNGAGKTSVLEAACLLSYARSFRSGSKDALLQRGAKQLNIYGEIRNGQQSHRLGLGRESGRWSARVDGESVDRLSDLIRCCAVVCFEPGSHALIAGAAEERRRFLDWGVFHVEHAFLGTWQRYRRALKQRNALLRGVSMPSDSLLTPWETEMDQCARHIEGIRQRYLQALEIELEALSRIVLPELGLFSLEYRCGWDASQSLAQALRQNREKDRSRGHTTVGIHRADWRPRFEHAPQREHFSRGQEKLCALACVLAQARVFAQQKGEWPVVCLDDLASELDEPHQEAVVGLLKDVDAQVLMTGTEVPAVLLKQKARMFHVEHGCVRDAA
ncbi:MAG TPA: DNA replication/repair protein RecF [Rhodanobacteraceae bacterium]|nr:DNA replication/repair protein RecF [Rhodanobacteraceae bacterium]